MEFINAETDRRVWVRNNKVVVVEDGKDGVLVVLEDGTRFQAREIMYSDAVDDASGRDTDAWVEKSIREGDAKIEAAVSLIKDGTPPEVASVLTGITIAAARALDQALS